MTSRNRFVRKRIRTNEASYDVSNETERKSGKLHTIDTLKRLILCYLSKKFYLFLFIGLITLMILRMYSSNGKMAPIVSILSYSGLSCQYSIEWKSMSFPTCNNIHEIDLQHSLSKKRLVGIGSIRSAWKLQGESSLDVGGIPNTAALKILLQEQDFDSKNFERHRVDALISERMSSSPHCADIYGFCGQTSLTEFGQGTLEKYRWDEHSSDKLIKVVLEAARGVKSVHSIGAQNINRNFQTLLVHNDIKPSQFLKVNDNYKLNDFNKAVFISYDKKEGKVCPFFNKVKKNTSKSRSPEEYSNKALSEKIDVFAFGNLIYFLLTYRRPFAEYRSRLAHKMISNGTRPVIPEHIRKSSDKNIIILLRIMKLCHDQDPDKRPTMQEIEDIIVASNL